jgi:hypothetical protein
LRNSYISKAFGKILIRYLKRLGENEERIRKMKEGNKEGEEDQKIFFS